jgi:IS5 family transposase
MSFEPKQIEMVCLEDLVSSAHIYRKFLNLWNLDSVRIELERLEVDSDYKGYGIYRIFLCLLLQFLEDLSDRELERFIAENASAKWFCQFGLVDKTPDHSVFGRARSRIGTNKLSKIFSLLRDQLKSQGYMSEVFTFVDATHLISKVGLWKERKAIELKLESLNNKTLEKVAADKDAKFGAKSKDKIWFGYKQHTSVDMQSGMINKVAITPANVIDSKGFKHNKRVRYRGIAKNQFSAFMQAITFNFKRLAVLAGSAPPPIIA